MKFKYNGSGTHRRALLHVIGQLEQVNGHATIADIAAFMNRSKTTATKYLKTLESNEEIIMSKHAWRGNAEIVHINMFEDIKDEYREGRFKNEYLHVQAMVINNA